MEHLSGRRHSALAEVGGGLPSTRQRAHQADRRGEGFIADIAATLQEMKNNVEPLSGSYGGCHYYRRRRPAAFCGGRQVSGTTIPCQSPLALRWTHTIVTATDFITSWEAADSAYFLAFDLGNVPLYASVSSHTPSRCTKRSQVRFDNDICVCLYHETITSQHSVPHESLQDPLKPWRLFPAQPDDRSAIPLSDWPGMIPAQQQIDLRHPFHAFMTDLSPLFEAGATTELLEEGPIAYIATWFLNHDPPGIKGLGPRPVRLNNDPLDWGEDILDAWSDILPLLPGQPNCDIVVVHPTPENGVATNYASHVILSVFGRPEQAGLLLTATVGGGVEHAAWPVLHHRTTVHDVEPLMQRPEPSQAPSLQQTHIIGLHLPIAPVVIDSEQPMLVNLADFWPYYPKPFHDVIALHPVHEPPTFAHLDALPTLIAQRDSDRCEQEQTDDVLALISVSLHAPHTSSHRRQRLKVLWVPARGTRANYVDFFRMTVHCRQATTLCFMYHNNVLWPEADQAIRSLDFGDHLRLQVRSDGTGWDDYVYTETAACQRRIFQPSSEPEPDERPERPEEESVTPSPRRVSRSRSRGRSRSSTESHSLLQLGRPSSIPPMRDSAQDAAIPHVSDLWCMTCFLVLGPMMTPTTDPDPQPEHGMPPTDDHLFVDFLPAMQAFDWIDSHFFLPTYNLDFDWPWQPVSKPWLTLPWWEPGDSIKSLWIYFDGSSAANKEEAGCGVSAFVFDGTWKFAGALSARLDPGTTSYRAEACGAALATKFIYDLLKIAAFDQPPEVWLCYDSTSVGEQVVGNWNVNQSPQLFASIRGLVLLIETRFQVVIQHHHVYGHSGEPGNEIVDTLAVQAGRGHALADMDTFLTKLMQDDFSAALAWTWFPFRRDIPLLWKDAHHCTLSLCLATLNVLTLKGAHSKQLGLQGLSRQTLILRQLFDTGAHIFALQETRQQKQTLTVDSNYVLITSSANKQGQY